MLRSWLSIVFLITCSPAAYADLRYTTRVEVRRTSPIATGTNAGAMDAMLQALMPPGETRTFVSGEAIRIEQTSGSTRSVILIRSDGRFIVYPDLRAYVPMPGDLLANSGSGEPPTFRRTGEFVTMLGVQAERILVTLPIVLPMTPPAGSPTRMRFDGEIWVADVYREEARGVQNALGAAVVPDGVEGMVLRQVLRNVESGFEILSTVVELVDEPIPAEMFRVPGGYRELNQLAAPGAAPGGSRRR